jgi:DNA-binding MarR family transcriptional regulator
MVDDERGEAIGSDESIARELWQTEIAVDRALDVALAPVGLSTTLLGVLAWLAREPGLSAADLARRAGVRPQSAARAVARLEALGLTARTPHPVHGKALQIRLTDAGWQAFAQGSTRLAAFERELEQDLSETDRRRLREQLATLRARADLLHRRLRQDAARRRADSTERSPRVL